MSKKRQSAKETASSLLGEGTDVAPHKPQTRSEKESQERKWGKPTSIRLHPDIREAMERAAKRYGVRKRDLYNFLLRASLNLLSDKKLNITTGDTIKRGMDIVNMPPVPDEFLE